MASNFEGTPDSTDVKVEGVEPPVNEAEVVSESAQSLKSEIEGAEKDVTNQNESKNESSEPKVEEVKNKENADNNLEQHLKEIQDKASEISSFLNNRENNNLEAVTTALKDAEEFMEDKKCEMGDAFNVEENHGKIETLEVVIDTLKQRKEELEKEKEPETARDFIKDLREVQKILGEKAADILTELTNIQEGQEEGRRDELKKQLASVTDSFAVAAGMHGAHRALEGMEENRKKSAEFLEYTRALGDTMRMTLSRIDIERKGMPLEQQGQAVGNLQNGAERNLEEPKQRKSEPGNRENLQVGKEPIFGPDGSEIKITDEEEYNNIIGEGEDNVKEESENIGEINCSVESSTYHQLIDFFRKQTSKLEARSEVARLLFMANKIPLSNKIMALPDDFYIIPDDAKKIEPIENDSKREVGTIAIQWKSPGDKGWRKTTIKATFNDYEDGGILSSLRRAFTSEEKSVSISVLHEEINVEKNAQEKDQYGSSVNPEDIFIDPLGESEILSEEQKAKINSSDAENAKETSSDMELKGKDANNSSSGQDIKELEKEKNPIETEEEKGGNILQRVIKTREGGEKVLSFKERPLLSSNDFMLSLNVGTTFWPESGGAPFDSGKIVRIEVGKDDEVIDSPESLNLSEVKKLEEGAIVIIEAEDNSKSVYYTLRNENGKIILGEEKEEKEEKTNNTQNKPSTLSWNKRVSNFWGRVNPDN